jgi:hypothetical protein
MRGSGKKQQSQRLQTTTKVVNLLYYQGPATYSELWKHSNALDRKRIQRQTLREVLDNLIARQIVIKRIIGKRRKETWHFLNLWHPEAKSLIDLHKPNSISLTASKLSSEQLKKAQEVIEEAKKQDDGIPSELQARVLELGQIYIQAELSALDSTMATRDLVPYGRHWQILANAGMLDEFRAKLQ